MPFEFVCFVSERPSLIKRDAEGRLHCDDGPALAFQDGEYLYHHHGVKIPEEWIKDPSSLTPEIALTWENIEQRRAAMEKLGWDKVISSLSPKTIDKDGDPQIGELLEVDLPDSPQSRFLKVLCGTGRTFYLPVPAEMKTALEANAWTYDLSPEDYTPEIRT